MSKPTVAKKRKIQLVHLYPEAMNLYGDMGNIRTLQHRAQWRDIEIETISVGQGAMNTEKADLVFFGGGQDRDQLRIYDDLLEHKKDFLRRSIEKGAAILAVCGGYQLLGNWYLDADGHEIAGLGLLNLQTKAGTNRWIGNVLIKPNPELQLPAKAIVGFENHGGKTTLGAGLASLGTVVVGGGNNGVDKTEGVVHQTVIGTYLHGSLLPKNPAVADWLLQRALRHSNQPDDLEPLDDETELAAHRQAVEIALVEKGRRPVKLFK